MINTQIITLQNNPDLQYLYNNIDATLSEIKNIRPQLINITINIQLHYYQFDVMLHIIIGKENMRCYVAKSIIKDDSRSLLRDPG